MGRIGGGWQPQGKFHRGIGPKYIARTLQVRDAIDAGDFEGRQPGIVQHQFHGIRGHGPAVTRITKQVIELRCQNRTGDCGLVTTDFRDLLVQEGRQYLPGSLVLNPRQ